MAQRRLPKQAHPDALKLDYLRALAPYVDRLAGITRDLVIPELKPILADTAKTDSPESQAKKKVDRLLKRAAKEFAGAIRIEGISEVAERTGKRTSEFQFKQLSKQGSTIGIDLKKIRKSEKGIDKKIEGWVALNIDLIKSLPNRYFDDVGLRIYEGIDRGTRHEQVAKELESRYDIPLNQAALIARDQVGKLFGDLNRARQENLGIRKYIWRTSNDNRVRPDHEDREGQAFSWDDPPADGHPGFPVQCRCNAEPDFSEVLS